MTVYRDTSQMLSSLGSFWSEIYTGVDQVTALSVANYVLELQTRQQISDFLDLVALDNAPLYDRKVLRPFVVKQSELNVVDKITYGSGLKYGEGYSYGDPAPTRFFSFPVASNLVKIDLITNRITDPSEIYVHTNDFLVENDAVYFSSNPFKNDNIAKQNVYDTSGNVIDVEAVMWAYNSDYEDNLIYKHIGHVLRLWQADSTPAYRKLVATAYDALVRGMTWQHLVKVFEAFSGIELAQSDGEVVEVIYANDTHTTIITDKHVYSYPVAATVLVSVGDVLELGEPLTDALQVASLNRAQIPTGVTSLAVDRNLLYPCYYSDLVFEDKLVPLTIIPYNQHPSGFTFISFPIGGFSADVERFFEDAHNNGVTQYNEAEADPCREPGRHTFAQALDVRPNPTTEPTALNLPTTINPLKFLVENYLRYNTNVIVVRHINTDTAAGFYAWSRLNQLIPPSGINIIVFYLSVTSVAIEDGLTWSADAPSYAPVATSTSITSGVTTYSTIKNVKGYCS